MTTQTKQRVLFVALLLLGAAWAVQNLRGSYVFYDEWSIIELIIHHPAHALVFHAHNGHMWVLASLMYRIQVHGWGLQSHWFINAVMVASLVGLHAALTRLFRALSASFLTAVLLAGAVTYLGAAGQNIVFAVQFSLILSLALAATAIGIVLQADPTRRSMVAVALLAAGSVLVENGGSLVLVPMLTVLVVGVWGRRAALALVPAWVIAGAWYVLAPSGPVFATSFGGRARYAGRLLLSGAGSLVGRAERAGAVVLAAMLVVTVVALVKGWLDQRGRWLAAGAVASLVCVIGAITMSRAGLPGVTDFSEVNRYLQVVALPLVIGSTPAFVACWRVRRPIGPFVAVAMFLLGIAPLQTYNDRFDVWSTATRARVHDVAVVLRDGCPSGSEPVLDSRPLDYIGPQVTGTLVADLIERGFLDVPTDAMFDTNPESDVLTALCPNG